MYPFKPYRNSFNTGSRRSHNRSRSSKRNSKLDPLGQSMPGSNRFKDKSSDLMLKKFNESNFNKSKPSRKRCEYPSDYYDKNSKEYSNWKKERSSANKRRKEYDEYIKSQKTLRKINVSKGGEPERAAYKPKKKTKPLSGYQKRNRSKSNSKRKMNKSRSRTPKNRKSENSERIKEQKSSYYKKQREYEKRSSQVESQAGEIKRSKSQNYAKHHNHCRCYICTCRRSNHQCPVSKGFGRPFLENTINRTDFKRFPDKFYKDVVDPMGKQLNTPEDNLKFIGKFKPNTDYRDNFQKKTSDSWKNNFKKDQNFHKFIQKKNNQDHIKDNLPDVRMLTKSQHRNYKHGDIDPVYYPLKKYRKSASPIRNSSPFLAKTVYQKDFNEWKNNPYERKKPFKHAENLRAYNPEIPMAKFTEYNKANYIHMINKKQHNPLIANKELYKLFKKRDNISGGVIPKNNMKMPKKSEYEQNYKKWKIQKNDCDLVYMPKVPSDINRLKEHIYWNKYKEDWNC